MFVALWLHIVAEFEYFLLIQLLAELPSLHVMRNPTGAKADQVHDQLDQGEHVAEFHVLLEVSLEDQDHKEGHVFQIEKGVVDEEGDGEDAAVAVHLHLVVVGYEGRTAHDVNLALFEFNLSELA
jgi:hypothetical protein